jgi:hypothetical protein
MLDFPVKMMKKLFALISLKVCWRLILITLLSPSYPDPAQSCHVWKVLKFNAAAAVALAKELSMVYHLRRVI